MARRLLARVGVPPPAGGEGPNAVADAEQASRRLGDELARWFGPYGYHALLTRALVEARAEHPVLADVRVRSPLDPWLDGLTDAALMHGAGVVIEGVAAVVIVVIELLGRLIGEDIAVKLVDQAMMGGGPNATGAPDAGGAA